MDKSENYGEVNLNYGEVNLNYGEVRKNVKRSNCGDFRKLEKLNCGVIRKLWRGQESDETLCTRSSGTSNHTEMRRVKKTVKFLHEELKNFTYVSNENLHDLS